MQIKNTQHIVMFLALVTLLGGCGNKNKKSDHKNRKHNSVESVSKRQKHQKSYDASAFDLDQETLQTFALDDAISKYDSKSMASKKDTQDPLFSWENLGAEESKNQFKTVYFEFDKDVIKPEQHAALNFDIKEAKQMIKNGKIIIIEGHACHSAGSAIYNLALSERRARYIAQKFAEAGVDASDIRIVGRGVEMPVRKGGSKSEQWVNRRVEIYAIDGSK